MTTDFVTGCGVESRHANQWCENHSGWWTRGGRHRGYGDGGSTPSHLTKNEASLHAYRPQSRSSARPARHDQIAEGQVILCKLHRQHGRTCPADCRKAPPGNTCRWTRRLARGRRRIRAVDAGAGTQARPGGATIFGGEVPPTAMARTAVPGDRTPPPILLSPGPCACCTNPTRGGRHPGRIGWPGQPGDGREQQRRVGHAL